MRWRLQPKERKRLKLEGWEDISGPMGSFSGEGQIVAARYFFLEPEARMYAAHLRQAGIPHYISNTNVMSALPLGGGGQIGLHVREADLAAAAQVFAQIDHQKAASVEEDFREADHEDIAYQQALNPSFRRLPTWAWLLGVMMLLLLLRALLRSRGWVNTWWDFF